MKLSGALSRLMMVSVPLPRAGKPGLSRFARHARRHRKPYHRGAPHYIQAVQAYNVRRSSLSNLTAMVMGYKPKAQFHGGE